MRLLIILFLLFSTPARANFCQAFFEISNEYFYEPGTTPTEAVLKDYFWRNLIKETKAKNLRPSRNSFLYGFTWTENPAQNKRLRSLHDLSNHQAEKLYEQLDYLLWTPTGRSLISDLFPRILNGSIQLYLGSVNPWTLNNESRGRIYYDHSDFVRIFIRNNRPIIDVSGTLVHELQHANDWFNTDYSMRQLHLEKGRSTLERIQYEHRAHYFQLLFLKELESTLYIRSDTEATSWVRFQPKPWDNPNTWEAHTEKLTRKMKTRLGRGSYDFPTHLIEEYFQNRNWNDISTLR